MAGYRSPLAFWVGGAASAPPPAATAGKRSLVAPWLGGASAPAPADATAGKRSLLAFWLGGASAAAGVSPPVPQPTGGGGGIRLPVPQHLAALRRQRLIEDEELLLAVLIAAIPGLMRRQ